MAVDFSEPVKCPECKTWWRGMEHRCTYSTVAPYWPPVYPTAWPPPYPTITYGTGTTTSSQFLRDVTAWNPDDDDDPGLMGVPA